MTDAPLIDYADLPYLPRQGIQAPGNYKYATRSLFLETAPDEEAKQRAMWCLAEHEVLAYGRWYPSAWMTFIHATDEYDALRKICGNVRQWEHIKDMRVASKGAARFEDCLLQDWRTEQAYLQRSRLREALLATAVGGGPSSVTAIRTLLPLIDNPVRGRPKKDAPKEKPAAAVEEAMSRVVNFQS